MAPRDYVKRGRAPKKTKTSKKPARPQGASRTFVAVTALLIGVFIFGLINLSGDDSAPQPQPKPEKIVVTQPVQKPKPVAEKKPLPPKPEETWSYIEELENKEVTVEAKKVNNKPKQPYLMQCGAYKTLAQAEERKAMIAFQGLTSRIHHEGSWYKVVLGPYPQKRQAESDRHKLQRNKIEPCAIWFWNID
ncbi:SPOR domain-containing protein [Vibrio stylophorae]|uniref:SPOR domain-containing protein n=1 Tax=Vibrio stylophorae TaxID=659351 RepID=UPI001EFFCCFB|nr:SPOR domain-containing protein [Vibrio stylophorae]